MSKKVTSGKDKRAGDGVPRNDMPARPITPPSNHRHDVLPLTDVGSVAFEKVCRDVVSYAYPAIVSAALKRDRGQRQFGVDVEGFDHGQRSAVAISAKCYQEVKARYLLPWTRDFTGHLDGHWKDKGVTHFVLAISACRNDDELNEAVQTCVAECAAHGIKFVLWDALLITNLLREEATLVDRYFHEYWVGAISPKRSPATAVTRPAASPGATSATILQLSHELVEVTRQRDEAIAERLEAAQREFRAGRHTDLVQWFTDLRANAGLWDGLSAAVKAKATRARAMVALHLGQISQARTLLDEADSLAIAPHRTPRAFLVRAEKGAEEALQLLQAPVLPRESEVRASLLLELGQVTEALAILNELPSPPSAEQLRIRAIAQCLAGEREAAVTSAIAARDKEPTSASNQQTLATLHVAAALSNREEPQFGSVPNPFNLGLVKRTTEAQQHLADALAIFEALAPTVDPLLRSDFDVWRLAILVMLTGKQDAARSLSAELLAPPAPQPLAIVWSRLAALPTRLGKLRKSLEDQLRKGNGSPTHVIVSAMLAADTNGDKAGASVIAQHMDKFPEATAFLEGWRQRFAGEPTGDAYADTMRAAMKNRDYAALVDFVAGDKASGGAILNTAQILRARGEWQILRSLEPQLLTIGTPRAVEFAAAAALRTSHPADAIRIIDDNASSFPEGRPPAAIQYLRSQANDALGLKHKAISDLQAAALASNDPHLQLELARSYIGIGNLATGKQHAEAYLHSPNPKPAPLIEVAQALKRSHPEFARQLVVKAALDPKLPKSLAPTVLVLATEMGHKDIERQMLEIVTDVARYGKTTKVQAFTIEELLEFIKGRNETQRRQFTDWIDGRTPSHVFLQGDLDRFSKLFLGLDEDRVSPAGERYPLLVRSYPVPLPSLPTETRPALRVDISALMLASRLDLIDNVEAAFQVIVPPSLPLSLVDMETSLTVPSQDVITACKNALDRTSALIEVNSVPPPDATSLADDGDPAKLDERALKAVLRLSAKKGIISQDQRTTALVALGMSTDDAATDTPPEALLLTPATAVALATSKLLEAVAQTLPTHISCNDRERLDRDIADAERAVSRNHAIRALRELVASRIESGSWHLLPKTKDVPHKNGHPLRAHTACLVELLQAAAQPVDGLFWIEDRAIQRGRHPQILGIVEVLDFLQRRDAIAPTRRQAAIEMLRSWGYGYLAPAADEFIAKLLAAPVQNGSVIETAELRAIRVWYAHEVDRLRHLDFQPLRDEAGGVAGEARHALDMLGLVIPVMRGIWNSPISSLEKQARSVWAWTCLRVEQTDFLPKNNHNSEGRLAIVASTFAQVAMMPFLSSVETNSFVEAAHQPFATWFFHGVLVPRCGYDPRLKDRVQDFIAGHLAALFKLSFEGVSPDDARAYFAEQVNRYLNLLPKHWQDGITCRHGLTEKLGLRTILVVNAGQAQIATDDLNQAIAQSIARLDQENPVTTALTGIDGTEVQLTLRRASGPLPLAELRCKEETVRIDPPFVAVAHPAQAVRLATLPGMSDAFEGRADAKRTKLEAIAREDNALERSRRFHALVTSSFARRLRSITDQSRQGSVDLDDLALPEPDVLATHLGLDSAELQSDQDIGALSAQGLGSHPPLQAASRIAALPFDLPEDLLRTIGTTVLAFRAKEPSTRPRASSPLHALLILRAVVAMPNVPEGVRTDCIDDVIDLTEKFAGLFAAFLADGAKVAAHDSTWRALCDETALSWLWCWADGMTAALVSGGVDPDEAMKLIHSLTLPDLAGELARGPRAAWYYDFTDGLDVPHLKATIYANLLDLVGASALSQTHADRIKAAIGHEVQNGWIPRLDLLFPRQSAQPRFWPSRDPIPSFGRTGWMTGDSSFSVRDHNALGRKLLDEPNPSNPFGHTFVLSFARPEALAPELREEILDHLRKLRYAPDLLANDFGLQRSLTQEARLLGLKGDQETMRLLLRERAAVFARRWPRDTIGYHAVGDKDGAAYAFTWLYDTIFTFVRAMEGLIEDKLRFFTAATAEIAGAWPRALCACIGALNDAAMFVDIDASAVIWPTLLSLRCTA